MSKTVLILAIVIVSLTSLSSKTAIGQCRTRPTESYYVQQGYSERTPVMPEYKKSKKLKIRKKGKGKKIRRRKKMRGRKINRRSANSIFKRYNCCPAYN